MSEQLYISGWCSIKDEAILINGKKERIEENFTNFAGFIKALFKSRQISYPKFYKMDNLSKFGFLTAELLLKESDVLIKHGGDDIGVVIANSSSSLDTDLDHQELIKDRSNYFPSPAVFVYTLPNIMIGEICIRHKIHGENAFLISGAFDPGQIAEYVEMNFEQERMKACICGWVEVMKDSYQSLLCIVEKRGSAVTTEQNGEISVPFGKENLYKLFNI